MELGWDRPIATVSQSEETDFGQSNFGKSNSGQSSLGLSWWRVEAPKGEGGGHLRVGPRTQKNGAPKAGALKGGAQNFAFFFPSPATIFILSSFLGVCSWILGHSAGALKCARLHSRAVV